MNGELRYLSKKIHISQMVGINKNNDFNILASLAPDDFMAIEDIQQQEKIQHYLLSVFVKNGYVPMFLLGALEYKLAIIVHPKFLVNRDHTHIYFVDKPVTNYKETDSLISITLQLPKTESFSKYSEEEVCSEMDGLENMFEKFGFELFFEKAQFQA